MDVLPAPLTNLIDELGRLPGVGARTAERYAFAILRGQSAQANELSRSIASLHEGVKLCPQTFMLIAADEKVSPLYSDPRRDKRVIAVVEEPLDVVALEKTGGFKGTYHVLGGVISPIDGIGPEYLHIKPLITRINTDKVNEVILATNASVEGEATALYLQNQLHKKFPELKLTRLARGLPAGTDLEYADHATLLRALEGRQTV